MAERNGAKNSLLIFDCANDRNNILDENQYFRYYILRYRWACRICYGGAAITQSHNGSETLPKGSLCRILRAVCRGRKIVLIYRASNIWLGRSRYGSGLFDQ